MYASCTRYGLETCDAQENRAFVNHAETELISVHLVELASSLVMIDTGGRAAVGGRKWHQGLQRRLTALGKEVRCEKHL